MFSLRHVVLRLHTKWRGTSRERLLGCAGHLHTQPASAAEWQLLLVYEMESTDHGTHVDENVGAIIFHGSRYLPPNFKIASMSSPSLSLSILIISDQNSQP